MWWKKTALILSAVGAINWGLNELGFNIVDLIFSFNSIVLMLIYYLIAICGVYALVKVFK